VAVNRSPVSEFKPEIGLMQGNFFLHGFYSW